MLPAAINTIQGFVSVTAGGYACTDCGTVLSPHSFWRLDKDTIGIVCQGCHRTRAEAILGRDGDAA
jgi:DNA-directed RNA polymerase subunit RPC12/RpoP